MADQLLAGILTSTANPDEWPPERRERFEEVAAAAAQAGVAVCVFAGAEANLAEGVVTGVLWYPGGSCDGTGCWLPGRYPLPVAVYNRIPSRRLEQADLSLLEALRRRLGPRLFNPGFFSKWSVYQVLQRSIPLRRHLPPTLRFVGAHQLTDRMRAWGSVYLKPIRAQAGQGILRLDPRPDTLWQLTAVTAGASTEQEIGEMQEIAARAAARIGDQPYLMQPAVPLARLNGRIYDLRTLVQKGGDGRWHLTGVGVRVASPGGVTTHVPRGGERATLKTVAGKKAKKVRRQVAALVKEAAQVLDQHHGGCLGELSCDVALDRYGNLWLLEVNSKPARFDEPAIRRRHFRQLGRYLAHLARLSRKRPSRKRRRKRWTIRTVKVSTHRFPFYSTHLIE